MTTLPALAEIDDLIARLPGEITGSDLTRAQAVLDDASTEVRFVARKDWVDEDDELDDDIPSIVVKTTLEVAQRAYLNPPNGVRQESLGDHSVTMDVRTGVYLTEDEKAKVRAAAAGDNKSSGLWTLSTTRGCDDIRDCVDFVYPEGGGDPIPYLELPT